jgi:acyl-CoA reductase-like NAD-dependent aldehyde dehydrogenase
LVAECGGKDAMIVAADADLDAAATPPSGVVWATPARPASAANASLSPRRSPTSSSSGSASGAQKLKVGADDDATIGPITMPARLDTIGRHIADGLADGGRAALGGAEAVQPP